MPEIKRLLENNQLWIKERLKDEPDFFKKLAETQHPKYLWIGCSDSRVSANRVVDLQPGELFVHRNIANMVVHTDLNCLSVIQYAVTALKVKHIIVCGHYGCGGIKAALDRVKSGGTPNPLALVDNWLDHIENVYKLHEKELKGLEESKQFRRFCELNVQEQVNSVCTTSIVQNAWKDNADLQIHGLIYDVANGELKDLNIKQKNQSEFINSST